MIDTVMNILPNASVEIDNNIDKASLMKKKKEMTLQIQQIQNKIQIGYMDDMIIGKHIKLLIQYYGSVKIIDRVIMVDIESNRHHSNILQKAGIQVDLYDMDMIQYENSYTDDNGIIQSDEGTIYTALKGNNMITIVRKGEGKKYQEYLDTLITVDYKKNYIQEIYSDNIDIDRVYIL